MENNVLLTIFPGSKPFFCLLLAPGNRLDRIRVSIRARVYGKTVVKGSALPVHVI